MVMSGIVEVLAEHGVDINRTSRYGFTSLMYSRRGAIRWLLDHGADVDATDDYDQTALHHAIDTDRLFRDLLKESFSLPLKHGSHVHGTHNNGNTALHFATIHSCTEMVEILLEAGLILKFGVTTIERRSTALLFCLVRPARIIKPLLNHGACTSTSDSDNLPPVTEDSSPGYDYAIESATDRGGGTEHVVMLQW